MDNALPSRRGASLQYSTLVLATNLIDSLRLGRTLGRCLVLTSLSTLGLAACGSDDDPAQETSSSSSDTSSDATTAETSTEGTDSTGDGDGDGDGATTSDSGGECLLWEIDDCVSEDLKCMPWSADPDRIPDELRCCDIVEFPKLLGETCSVLEYDGSCLDDCEEGVRISAIDF